MELNRTAFERNEAAFERNTQAFERLMAVLDRYEERFDQHERLLEETRADKDDLKVFIREISLRAEKRDQEWRQHNEDFRAEQAARTDAVVRHLDDLREESRAQREALLALIDRMPPPGPGGLRAVE